MSDATSIQTGKADIEQIGRVLDGLQIIDESVIATLRSTYPYLRFTLCSEDDMGEREPYQAYREFDLYLATTHLSRCSHITYDIGACSAVVVALHEG